MAHRDVKPENVLVDYSLQDLLLVDFNAAGRAEHGFLTPTGTKMYAAPEVHAGGSPSEASDVWGAGLCLHLMLAGVLPKRATKQEATIDVTLRGECWLASRSAACARVTAACLQVQEQARPTAGQLLQLQWVGACEPVCH